MSVTDIPPATWLIGAFAYTLLGFAVYACLKVASDADDRAEEAARKESADDYWAYLEMLYGEEVLVHRPEVNGADDDS